MQQNAQERASARAAQLPQLCCLLPAAAAGEGAASHPGVIAIHVQAFCAMQTEVKAYQKLKQRQKGASIAPQLLGHGALKINGASHPYMVMQRLGESLELFTDDRGLELPKTVFVLVCHMWSCYYFPGSC